MGKIAFLFAGQGAQAPGMGQSLYQNCAAARAVFDTAEAALPGLQAMCFSGTSETLVQTINTQPCVYTVALAAASALQAQGVTPNGVEGFSLGEVAALCFAGAFSQAQGIRLVCRRAQLMQQASQQQPGCMYAVLRLSDAQVEEICTTITGAYPVNYNADGQLVVACTQAAAPQFEALLSTMGARARRLAVSGGFHSPMMQAAAQSFLTELNAAAIAPPALPVYANAIAAPYPTLPKEIAALLAQQMQSPVLFKQSIAQMCADGFDTFIEVGPGKTLTGLVKRIAPQAVALSVQTAEDVKAVAFSLA